MGSVTFLTNEDETKLQEEISKKASKEEVQKAIEENAENDADLKTKVEALQKDINALKSKPPARIGEVTLLAKSWVGSDNLHSQVVNIEGVTINSQVDLTPSVQQLSVFYLKDLAFVTENDNGVITVYAIGERPQNDYTIQVTITEVEYE